MLQTLLLLMRMLFGKPPFEQRKLQAIAIRRDGRTVARNDDWNAWQRLVTWLGWRSDSACSHRQSDVLDPFRKFWRALCALPSKLKASLRDAAELRRHAAAENSNL